MLTEHQQDVAARRLCIMMGRNPNNMQDFKAAEYEINMWLKCMQAVEQAEKAPPYGI